jgi:hypothetical protein
LIFLLYGITSFRFALIFLISGISSGRFLYKFLNKQISLPFNLLKFGISKARFASILKKCQDQSFVSLRFDIVDIAIHYILLESSIVKLI